MKVVGSLCDIKKFVPCCPTYHESDKMDSKLASALVCEQLIYVKGCKKAFKLYFRPRQIVGLNRTKPAAPEPPDDPLRLFCNQ